REDPAGPVRHLWVERIEALDVLEARFLAQSEARANTPPERQLQGRKARLQALRRAIVVGEELVPQGLLFDPARARVARESRGTEHRVRIRGGIGALVRVDHEAAVGVVTLLRLLVVPGRQLA